jgi:hypothetical protein
MLGYTKISKKDFYMRGGFANPACVRISRSGSWAYYYKG